MRTVETGVGLSVIRMAPDASHEASFARPFRGVIQSAQRSSILVRSSGLRGAGSRQSGTGQLASRSILSERGDVPPGLGRPGLRPARGSQTSPSGVVNAAGHVL